MKSLIKTIVVLAVLAVLTVNTSFTTSLTSGPEKVEAAGLFYRSASYYWDSDPGWPAWNVRAHVTFDWRFIPGRPGIQNVKVECDVTRAIVYTIIIQRCSPNLGGYPTESTMNGRPVTIYRPGIQYQVCAGVVQLGAAICWTYRTLDTIVKYDDTYNGIQVWAPEGPYPL